MAAIDALYCRLYPSDSVDGYDCHVQSQIIEMQFLHLPVLAQRIRLKQIAR